MTYDSLPTAVARRYALQAAHIRGLHGTPQMDEPTPTLATYGCDHCADEVREGIRAEPDPITGEPVLRPLTACHCGKVHPAGLRRAIR